MGADYPGAIWIPTSHFWGGHGGQKVSWIILHGTAGGSSAQEVAGWFQTNNPPTSTHFIIGRDGAVVQCVNTSNSAWGNGVESRGHASWWNPGINPNLQTISIEHVKSDPSNNQSLTKAQQDASFKLVAYLCAKHNIPARAASASGGITGHFSIDPVNRSFCPGTYPWSELFSYLGHPGNLQVPGGLNNIISGTAAAIKIQAIAKAPLSGGILGMVEQVDEWEQIPEWSLLDTVDVIADPLSIAPWLGAFAEGLAVRTMIVLFGLMIVIICMFNVAKDMVEAESQIVGPVIGAATGGAL